MDDPMAQVTRRPTTDPGGKLVDVYTANPYLSGICLHVTGQEFKDSVRALLLNHLRKLSTSPNSRRRDRNFSIFYGEFVNRLGQQLVMTGLPDRFDSNLAIKIQTEVSKIGTIVEVGRSEAADVNAAPLLRYEHGHLIAYVDPFLPVGHPLLGRDVELRSYEYVATSTGPKRQYPMSVTRSRKSRLHSIDSWERERLDIMHFIYDTIEPESFLALKRHTKKSFGITVIEEVADTERRYGSIAIDWVDNDQNVEVSIYVNRALHSSLKYVVLAHELAHYVLHFPLLLFGQMVEQLSWETPAIERTYGQLVSHILGDDRRRLEYQANAFASYFLIPPQCDHDRLASITCEGGRVPSGEELAWRFLQRFFPDRAHVEYSWHNWDEMFQRAQEELESADGLNAAGDDSLFLSLLSATSRRSSQEIHELSRAIDKKILQLGRRVANLHKGASVGRLDDESRLNLNIQSELRNSRKVVRSREGGPRSRCRPLVPSSGSRKKWSGVLDNSLPPASLADWQQRCPDDTLLLYEHMKMPTRSIWRG